ncbi:uncharacterized protein VNE69_12121 [Vairimorpha necatrix]|uniref:Uncharacterized protein n=1 Tax=Vairimorpha necatrix TaxID=6039 RepID=A0AAX4JIA4_9MICR
MLIFTLIFILNIKKVMTNSEDDSSFEKIEFTNEELKKCCKILFHPDVEPFYHKVDFYEGRTMEKIIFEAIIDKLNFPMKSKYNWPAASNTTDYEILKEDVTFSTYRKSLNIFDINKVRHGKEAALYVLFRSILHHLLSFYRTMRCIHVKKMNEHYGYQVLRVFNKKDFKKIAEEINQSLGEDAIMIKDDINLQYKKMNASHNITNSYGAFELE